ncbi:MAG: sigma-70 family RNA polymerase sigma factor [Acidobacteriaceae bacterium]
MRPEVTRATELLQQNDAAAVNEALRLLQNTVFAFSMKICGHAEDAEDTAQEVFVRSLPHLAKISEPKALAVWLYKVARNRCWRMRRKGSYAPERILSLSELTPDETELSQLLKDPNPDAEAQVSSAQQNARLQEMVLVLPPAYRMVLVLHDMEDLDTEQIAQVLGISQGTVRVRLHRARLYLRKILATEKKRIQSSAQPDLTVQEPRGRRKGRKGGQRALTSGACKEVFANLSEYMDGRIAAVECEQIREHIEGCRPCVAFLSDLRRAIDRCRSMESPCSPETNQTLRELLTQEYLRMVDQREGSARSSPA